MGFMSMKYDELVILFYDKLYEGHSASKVKLLQH